MEIRHVICARWRPPTGLPSRTQRDHGLKDQSHSWVSCVAKQVDQTTETIRRSSTFFIALRNAIPSSATIRTVEILADQP